MKDLTDNFIEDELMVDVLKMLRLASWSNLEHKNLVLEVVKLHGKIVNLYKTSFGDGAQIEYVQNCPLCTMGNYPVRFQVWPRRPIEREAY